jgi:hypothetical protein
MTVSEKKTHTITRLFSQCPHCDEPDQDVTHYIDRTHITAIGPFLCKHCTRFYKGTINRSGPPVFCFEACEGDVQPTWDLLSLDLANGKTMFFVVPGSIYKSKPGESITAEQRGLQEFVYESKMCPSDWLEPEAIICDGDDDPHGVIKYVDSVPRTSPYLLTEGDMSDYEDQPVQHVRDLFPHLFEGQGVPFYFQGTPLDSKAGEIAFDFIKNATVGSGIQTWNHELRDLGSALGHALGSGWMYFDSMRYSGVMKQPSSLTDWGNNAYRDLD